MRQTQHKQQGEVVGYEVNNNSHSQYEAKMQYLQNGRGEPKIQKNKGIVDKKTCQSPPSLQKSNERRGVRWKRK